MKKLVIGITGGIGSGKSTVSKIYRDRGYVVINADEVAKKIMIEDEKVIITIKSTFGNECYDRKVLNRKILANKVFSHPEELKKLNNIVHPPTRIKIKEEIQNLSKSNNLIFVEAALIFEANMNELFNYILLITADEDLRIKRLLQRENESIAGIRSRMLNQIPEDIKKGKSDFIIENNSTLEELTKKSLFFLNLLKNLSS